MTHEKKISYLHSSKLCVASHPRLAMQGSSIFTPHRESVRTLTSHLMCPLLEGRSPAALISQLLACKHPKSERVVSICPRRVFPPVLILRLEASI